MVDCQMRGIQSGSSPFYRETALAEGLLIATWVVFKIALP